MEKIAAATNVDKGKFTFQIRAINPDGFEEHKKTLSDLAETDLVDRFEHVRDDWPIYALLVPIEGDKEEDIQHKDKKKKN